MAERRKPLGEIERLRKEIEALRQERESSSEKPEEEACCPGVLRADRGEQTGEP